MEPDVERRASLSFPFLRIFYNVWSMVRPPYPLGVGSFGWVFSRLCSLIQQALI